MVWSHNDQWMVTGDHGGYVKYWQANMNNVKMFQAHKEPVRRVSFSPTDAKFATCSDDGTVRIFDFFTCTEERVLRGHGSDVKCVDWHPSRGLLASGSKDNQQPIKLWEPRTGSVLATLHAHKSTVMDIEWNRNGNWLLTASRDHLLKLFDIRQTKEELQTFRGHKKEASTLAWHPVHEGLLASGGSDGAIMFWNVGADKEVGVIEAAHESIIWSLDWHPVGHILCSGSNDHTCKFWSRNCPGDTMRDKYNLNTMIHGQEDELTVGANRNHMSTEPTTAVAASYAENIPGMAPEDRVASNMPPPVSTLGSGASGAGTGNPNMVPLGSRPGAGHSSSSSIPGLDSSSADSAFSTPSAFDRKKTPYSKPIPRSFQASWNATPGAGGPGADMPPLSHMMPGPLPPQVSQPPHPEAITLLELQRRVTAVVAFGNVFPILPGSNLSTAIVGGEHSVKDVLCNEFLT